MVTTNKRINSDSVIFLMIFLGAFDCQPQILFLKKGFAEIRHYGENISPDLNEKNILSF